MTTLNQAFLRAYDRERNANVPGPHIGIPRVASTPSANSLPSAPSPDSGPQAIAATPSAEFMSIFPALSSTAISAAEPVVAPRSPAATAVASHSASASTSVEASSKLPFVAAWEADELPWSDVCDRLRDESGPELLAAIARWRAATQGGLADGQTWPGPLVLGVTSLIRREGRTTVSAGLARAAVAAGLRVALLDADLENPRLSSAAEVAIDATWVDCVVGDAPLGEAAVNCPANGFHLFPLVGSAKQSTFHWNAPSAVRVFRTLRRHFDLCLLDMGPLTDALKRGLQGGADSPLDGVLLLRDVRITGADQVLLIARELHQAGLPIVGVVDNFNDSSEHSRCMKATGS